MVKRYHLVETEDGDILHAKFCSAVLEESEELSLVNASNIIEKVSIVHNCDQRCMFANKDKPRVEEREIVSAEREVFEHDFTNNCYLLNRFYLGESWKYIPEVPE